MVEVRAPSRACQAQCLVSCLDWCACNDVCEFIMHIFLLVKLFLVPILKLYHYSSCLTHWVEVWGVH